MAYGGFINRWTPPRNVGDIPQVSTIFSLGMEMSRLAWDGTAKTVLRGQGANGDREIFIFPSLADHAQDWQPYPIDPNSC